MVLGLLVHARTDEAEGTLDAQFLHLWKEDGVLFLQAVIEGERDSRLPVVGILGDGNTLSMNARRHHAQK